MFRYHIDSIYKLFLILKQYNSTNKTKCFLYRNLYETILERQEVIYSIFIIYPFL